MNSLDRICLACQTKRKTQSRNLGAYAVMHIAQFYKKSKACFETKHYKMYESYT